MLTTVKTMKKKKETAHQNLEKISRNTRKKLREKSSYFIEKKRTLTQHQQGRFMQNFEILKQKVKPKTELNE
jgi:hypothetical protein